MIFTQAVARTIFRIRRERGYSQSDLAAHLGLTRVGATGIESGRQNINVEQLRAIADFLQVTPCTLLSGFIEPPRVTISRDVTDLFSAYMEGR